jgi:hypothetical protein
MIWNGSEWELQLAANVVKTLYINIGATGMTESLNVFGRTTDTENSITLLGIYPEILAEPDGNSTDGERLIARNLMVSATSKIATDGVNRWIVYNLRVKNDNIDDSWSFTVAGVRIAYFCNTPLSTYGSAAVEEYVGW